MRAETYGANHRSEGAVTNVLRAEHSHLSLLSGLFKYDSTFVDHASDFIYNWRRWRGTIAEPASTMRKVVFWVRGAPACCTAYRLGQEVDAGGAHS